MFIAKIDYIVNQIDILGESNPAIKLVKPLAKRAIINNIDSFDKFINTIAKDGKIDIEGIVDEEIEIIKSIPNFDFSIPVLGNGNISNGNITISIPFINKGITTTTKEMNIEVTMNIIEDMMMMNVCFLCECSE